MPMIPKLIHQVVHTAGVARLPGHEDHDPNVCDVRTG